MTRRRLLDRRLEIIEPASLCGSDSGELAAIAQFTHADLRPFGGRHGSAPARAVHPPKMSAADALDKLAKLLNESKSWDTSLVVDIAELVRATGRAVQ